MGTVAGGAAATMGKGKASPSMTRRRGEEGGFAVAGEVAACNTGAGTGVCDSGAA